MGYMDIRKGGDFLVKFPITSHYKSTESFRSNPHNGIDFGFPRDSKLYSVDDGVVSRIVTDQDKTGFGNAIFIKLKNGNELIYAHMNKINVNIGDKIKTNDYLGLSGNTGNVTGSNGGYHLHLALKNQNGNYVNPEQYIPLVQNMDDNIVKYSDNIQKLDAGDMLRQAMEGFTQQKINMVSQLFDIHTISQVFHIAFPFLA